jgi:hypothetical protein
MIQAAAQITRIPEESDFLVIARAAEFCNPFLDALGEVTLMTRGPVASSVLNWNASIFCPLIQPVLLDVLTRASDGGSFEITTLDCRLDASLPATVRLQSRDAGKRVVQGLLAPRGDRLIERYRNAVLAGNSPGHLAVIHALRAAVFHLPPRVLIASYLMQEGIGAGLDDREIERFLLEGVCGAIELTIQHTSSHE